ncbi:hypothetical protein ASPZODRAFT_133841 [Penicilliopsis zonata CBS 506.65]|uniref:Glyoxalase-like domain-containing protein n=1 Tax=Penicilliopsis zonata CBS 506.65 TaxID=1073090 RepID=A0A1L9SDE0_9EURO|nr:hypothetical protein ASPZODRAFT_133841 [Penicilliopsis zonata CBS 506.65]OJJ45216.1 hypothetical protein ASPZODRAFT_133841 [Penicilliopsis zonata CBS 506.65]
MILDHIVILVSYDDLQAISARISPQLTLAPGGKHADGLTANKLVLLPDGVYLEFIAFFPDADPAERAAHRWGCLPENSIIDWALTATGERDGEGDFEASRERLRAVASDIGVQYQDLVPGGRVKPNGTVLKWAVSQAFNKHQQPLHPGLLPFWCLDRTPREFRVPYATDEAHLTTHPSGVRGVAAVSVQVPAQDFHTVKAAYDAVFGPASADGSWPYTVPAASGGRHTVSLSQTEGPRSIQLVLEGPGGTVELLPGVLTRVE